MEVEPEPVGHEIDAKFEKWRKPLQWGVAILILLIAYAVIYPALFLILGSETEVLDDLPSWLESFLMWTLAPLEWLAVTARIYEVYIEWLAEFISEL